VATKVLNPKIVRSRRIKTALKEPPKLTRVVIKSEVEEVKPKPKFVDHYDLPAHYGTTSLALIARDPNWIYAYWEIAPSSLETVRKNIGERFHQAAFVLRMYDVTCVDFNGYNANHWFDIEVGPQAGNWYVNIWSDNVSYCADIGLRLPDGNFFVLARSNSVTTPRKVQSWRTEQIWMEVKEDKSKYAPFVIGSVHKSDPISGKQPQNIQQPSTQNKRKYYLSEDEIRQYYSRLSPLLRDIISRRLAAKGAAVRRPGTHQRRGKQVTLEEFRLSGLSWGQYVKKMLGGASEELVLMGASEQQHVGGASEQSQREARFRKFFFEIGTELIVYGRTEPDATVTLCGMNVPLRSDGTFTMRFALPDAGKVPLDFSATSADKVETREISTKVDRVKTRYNP
jgi:hypothetical protein